MINDLQDREFTPLSPRRVHLYFGRRMCVRVSVSGAVSVEDFPEEKKKIENKPYAYTYNANIQDVSRMPFRIFISVLEIRFWIKKFFFQNVHNVC